MGTKETILTLFEKNRGDFISGERLAGDLEISRTAIWKAVRKLRKEGYRIDAVTNRGYRMPKSSDILSVQGISHLLSEDCSNVHLEIFKEAGSTNDICLDRAAAGAAEGYVAIADSQTSGKGRRGRSFYSPPGSGLYMSILLRPERYVGKEVLRLTTMAAVAVCEAIETVSDIPPAIKWVNDIYMENRKVCGILCEASSTLTDGHFDAVTAGIGINVYPPEGGFPKEIADIAGSIAPNSRIGIRNRLAAGVLNRFMYYYSGRHSGSYFDEYRKRSLVIGKDIEISGDPDRTRAYVTGLDSECGLMVRYEDGSEGVLRSGEISIERIIS